MNESNEEQRSLVESMIIFVPGISVALVTVVILLVVIGLFVIGLAEEQDSGDTAAEAVEEVADSMDEDASDEAETDEETTEADVTDADAGDEEDVTDTDATDETDDADVETDATDETDDADVETDAGDEEDVTDTDATDETDDADVETDTGDEEDATDADATDETDDADVETDAGDEEDVTDADATDETDDADVETDADESESDEAVADGGIQVTAPIESIADALVVANIDGEAPQFTSLLAALLRSEYNTAIYDGTTELTVFAPSDAAFEDLPEGMVSVLLEDTETMMGILDLHIVEGAITSDMLEDGMEIESLSGQTLTITFGEDGAVFINGAQITETDITAGSSVIHVIDTVLLPQN